MRAARTSIATALVLGWQQRLYELERAWQVLLELEQTSYCLVSWVLQMLG